MQITSTGMLTARIHDRPPSSRIAMNDAADAVIGAATSSVHVISTSICTCCTSLVIRVISDGAPNWPISRAEKSVTWWKMPLRTSRPKPIAAFGTEVDGDDREDDLHQRDERASARRSTRCSRCRP